MSAPQVQWHGPEMLVDRLLETKLFIWVTGNPGSSKSVIMLAMAARLTRGLMPGDFAGTPINVLYVSTEGTFLRSHGPRFEINGGDFTNFTHLNETLELPSKIERLEEVIVATEAKVVIIDPISYHLDASVHVHTKTTAELGKIAKLAEKHDCTIIAVDWPSKSRRKGDMSVPGNRAFTGVPRQVLAVGRLKGGDYVIGITKPNDIAQWLGWVYSMEIVDMGMGANKKRVTSPRITFKRPAKPSEVQQAHEQADIADDPNMKALLQFMNPSSGVAAKFETGDLITYLTNTQLMGKHKARDLVMSCARSGYLEGDSNHLPGADQRQVWWITPIGIMNLGADEESIEAAITTLFPPIDWPGAPPSQLALPAAKVTKKVSKRATKRTTKGA